MVAHKNVPLSVFLHVSNKRSFEFYANIINKDKFENVVEPNAASIESFISSLDYQPRQAYIDGLLIRRDQEMLEQSEFDWMTSDKRACNFAWLYLRKSTETDLVQFLEPEGLFKNRHYSENDTFENLVITGKPTNYENNLQDIKKFYDLQVWGKSAKKNLMSSLEAIWTERYQDRLNFAWLNKKDDEQCEWAWEYTKRNFEESGFFKPIKPSAMYGAIYAVLDCWDVGVDTKKLFSSRFKKAWDQKVYRNKQVGRSPLNVYIDKDSKKMLDLMADRRHENIYQTLERLIKKAHKEGF
ncbi:hypothetical protein [Kushneria indalinina]|uniref:Uncharacterized protein n=1 Tax=Kushneria indalinina DSM 14324 TaxID=1122140 RepID=A0A3D9DW18_9GAMM|nr:hypothetical protein [Kushneria indalinina]REC94962.1 hypothetical protein C8D72_1793 [Kushneria indalinina DSM 14324]